MSDLQPRGIPFHVAGKERHLLFTFSAIEKLQDKYDAPLTSIVQTVGDPIKSYSAIVAIMETLINDEIERTGSDEPPVTAQMLSWEFDETMKKELQKTILAAYGISSPEPEEDDAPNLTRSRNS